MNGTYQVPQLPDYQIPQAPCSNPFTSGLTLMDVCTGQTSTSLFLNMLSLLTTYSTTINGVCDRITPTTQIAGTYDFIVVGGKIINVKIITTRPFFLLDVNRDIFAILFQMQNY